jgi:predicted metal-dependent hydrolase
MKKWLEVEDLQIEIRHSQRKSIGITVDRWGGVNLAVPEDCSEETIHKTVHENLFWVHKKLAEKSLLAQGMTGKQYVTGEGFYYLGRSYRLMLVEPEQSLPPLRLYRGRFVMRRDMREQAQDHFRSWYVLHGFSWLSHRVKLYAERMDVNPGEILIEELGYRWASCGKNRDLHFHWRGLTLPPIYLEYLIVHELAHFHEPYHTNAFWKRIELVIPDYARRKKGLAEQGAEFI